MNKYRVTYLEKQICIEANNIREAAEIACNVFLLPDGKPISVCREVSGKTHDYCCWRGKIWPYTMLVNVKNMFNE